MRICWSFPHMCVYIYRIALVQKTPSTCFVNFLNLFCIDFFALLHFHQCLFLWRNLINMLHNFYCMHLLPLHFILLNLNSATLYGKSVISSLVIITNPSSVLFSLFWYGCVTVHWLCRCSLCNILFKCTLQYYEMQCLCYCIHAVVAEKC